MWVIVSEIEDWVYPYRTRLTEEEKYEHGMKDPMTGEITMIENLLQADNERIQRLRAMVAAIDREMEARKMDVDLTPEERLEVFGDFAPEAHAEETRERWGDTEAYRESRRRVSSYTKENWLEIRTEHEEISARFAALFESGEAPESEEAMAAAETHRLHISRWFYDCGHEMHLGLTEMYVADERFRANYDALAEGLSEFIRDAARANAENAS